MELGAQLLIKSKRFTETTNIVKKRPKHGNQRDPFLLSSKS